jgi:2-haloacid dehalogenase
VKAVVFDIGGVVLDWDPRHLYRRIFDDEEEVERFLTSVCTLEWHAQHDLGRPMEETIPLLSAEHPQLAAEIAVWRDRYVDMVAGHLEGMVELLAELGRLGVPTYALSNMPAEVLPELLDAFPALADFEGMIISGEERLAKPSPDIFHLLIERFGLEPNETVFVDDVPANVDAAWTLGFLAVRFESAALLRRTLAGWGVPVSTLW